MHTIEIILITAIANICCFYLGAKVGQKVVKGEDIKVEIPNPINAIKEHKEIKEVEKEQTKLDIMVENIDNYNGTDLGQKEIPR